MATMTSAADAKSAQEIATTFCAGCHGQNGVPISADIPVIWGQRADYLFRQLSDFKSGARDSPMMQPNVADLSPADRRAFANYFGVKTWPKLGQPAASAQDAARASADIASGHCAQCHLDGFRGDAANPRLAGQNILYLQTTMQAFHDDVRANNPAMSALMKPYSDDDVSALARYLGGL